MRISDWSSDVCSSDLIAHPFPFPYEADLVPSLEVRRAPQLHAAVGLVIAITVERPDEIVEAVAAERHRRVAHRLAGHQRLPRGDCAVLGDPRRRLPYPPYAPPFERHQPNGRAPGRERRGKYVKH